jgi:hypothetical protein
MRLVFHTLVNLIDSSVLASDGIAGRVIDAYVDDRTWAIRYLLVLVADPDGEKEMVCFPEAINEIDAEEGWIRVDQLSPRDCASAAPHRNVRSWHEVLGCAVSAWSGTIGSPTDAIFEIESWVLRFLLIDDGGLCNGAMVLLQPILIDEMLWDQSSLRVTSSSFTVLYGDDAGAVISAAFSETRTLH